jgi:hypothetical protein
MINFSYNLQTESKSTFIFYLWKKSKVKILVWKTFFCKILWIVKCLLFSKPMFHVCLHILYLL